eukprot:487984-Pelagomonas_calceolata.AAC.2
MADSCRRDGLDVRLIASGNGSHRYVDCVPRVAGKEKALQVCDINCYAYKHNRHSSWAGCSHGYEGLRTASGRQGEGLTGVFHTCFEDSIVGAAWGHIDVANY